MKTKRIKTAIFGTGFMSRVHLEAICRLGFIEVGGIASSDPNRARSLAADYGLEGIETDYRRILDDPSIQVVHICTPTAQHARNANDALEAGKHVLCEKPLATSVAEARHLVELARQKGVRHCINHNLRYYPLVQHMRSLRESGELGEILVVQGTYSQDYLLFETDWNWRLDSKESGPSCAMADIGSHWCDMAEFITGLGITQVCADLNSFHPLRKRARLRAETFAGQGTGDEAFEEIFVDNEDFGAVLLRIGDHARGSFTAGEVMAGRKNQLRMEVYGSKASVTWNQERPDELWIGHRDSNSQLLLRDSALLQPGARPYTDLPAGHAEGYGETFKNVFRRFYQAVLDPAVAPDYPEFEVGLRQLTIIEAELASNETRGWVEVPQRGK